jgi:hypothetical protein
MKVVIEIDEKLYNYMQTEKYDEHLDKRFDYQIRFAVKDGTPLPKGHGRLIDADALEKKMCDREEELGDDRALWESSAVSVALDMFAPTIIEKDRSEGV